jgi:ferredoxin
MNCGGGGSCGTCIVEVISLSCLDNVMAVPFPLQFCAA